MLEPRLAPNMDPRVDPHADPDGDPAMARRLAMAREAAGDPMRAVPAPAAEAVAGAEPVALGQDEGGARLAFGDQIRFFRRKLNLSTRTWTDIWRSQHDVAFMVAGAAKADLVNDLRGAVDAAIADGETLASFRARFDAIVEKHGWSYKGGRDWRTRVIYGTNLRTSYAAGRYEQMKEAAGERPYWRYRHSDASESPRLDHQSWDGLVLRHDDPWWDTHYPPNGWGCKCFVESLSQRDMERLGKDGPDRAPGLDPRQVAVGRGTRVERLVSVPAGIDPGWAYAPGQAASAGDAVRNATRAPIAQELGIAARGIEAILARPGAMAAHADAFARWRRGSSPESSGAFRLGVVPAAVQDRQGAFQAQVNFAALPVKGNDELGINFR